MRKMPERIFLLLLCCAVLGGCGNGVSQDSYNQLLDSNSALKKENVNLQEQILDLKREKGEYEAYKEQVMKYEDVFQYADEIKDYGNIKSEIEKVKEEKAQLETRVQELTAQWQELEQKIKNAKNPKPESNSLVYSDKNVEIYFSEITNRGVVFEVKNLTDINLTFQADSVAINGISTNSILMSDDVAPQSVGKIVARCSDFKTSENVYTVSGQLKVIDFSGSWTTYKAKFVNVEIK